MKTILSLLLMGATPVVAEKASSKAPLALDVHIVSQKCKPLFTSSADEEGTLLDFNDTSLQVGSDKKIDLLSCKISWKPSLPKDKRLKSAKLLLIGDLRGHDVGEGILRVGHKMLGTGNSPDIESISLSQGPFSYERQVQNISDDNCGLDVKLISSFSLLLTRSPDWNKEALHPAATLTLDSVRLLPLELEDCKEKDLPEEAPANEAVQE